MLRNTSRNRNILVSIGVYILLVLSFSGTLIGTYAWFSYNTRANSTYRGTAVNNRGELKIGIYSETELLNAEELSLIKDNDNPNVYWGSGGLKPEQLTYYLETVGYASNTMNACTSSSRDYEGDLDLHTYPTALDNSFIHVSANKKDYVYLPLVFSMPGQEDPSNLYINEANVRSNGNLNKAVRIHVASELTKFVFAPCNASDGLMRSVVF